MKKVNHDMKMGDCSLKCSYSKNNLEKKDFFPKRCALVQSELWGLKGNLSQIVLSVLCKKLE